MPSFVWKFVTCIASLALLTSATSGGKPQEFRAAGEPVGPTPQGVYVCEAEEFKVESPGWQAKSWGENYYAATFANSFLSRKAFLGAPEQCEAPSTATINVDVKDAGRYLVLVRYEAAYRFETQFNVKVEQAGKVLQDRLYGARDNVKVWAFHTRLAKEVAWGWGAVENIVWEGHEALVDLQPGPAKITLAAGKQSGNGARRNVDVVLLTRDAEDVKARIEKEAYLPLDGLLTQAGDVSVKVTNTGTAPLTLRGGTWQEHSPYWMHMRDPKTWNPVAIKVEPGKTSEWVDVGGTMDALNDGQWSFAGDGASYKLEFALKSAAGQLEKIGEFAGTGILTLAGDADTRYGRRIRTQDQVLHDLMAYLEKIPVHGTPPTRTLVYGATIRPADDNPTQAAAARKFREMYGLADDATVIDVREITTDKLPEYCEKLGEKAKKVRVISLGDEIVLGAPDPTTTSSEAFRAYLKSQNLKPTDVDPVAGEDWGKVKYNPDPALKISQPGVFYWSKRYGYQYGIDTIKTRTDILLAHMPHAHVGANYSPHHTGPVHTYLGIVAQWVSCFRKGGMTMPWGEDYIWQVPVGSPQMNGMNLDLFRAGNRGKPEREMHYYVMPHSPGNTPRMWRRLFHNAIARGVTVVNLFEFDPVWWAYSENHVTGDEMYGTVLKTFRELGQYEDILQGGNVRASDAGLWFSETGDIWDDNGGSFGPAKRALYVMILQSQMPVDVVVEDDAVDGTLGQYKLLYLTDNHVSRAASRKIAEWVNAGGRLFATAGAGMFDELNQPNTVMRELLGVDQTSFDATVDAQVGYLKQDLPFATPVATVRVAEAAGALDVFGVVSHVAPAAGADVRATFADGTPAIVARRVGKGETTYCAFLPSLSAFRPAIPLRPVDRGSSDDAMAHFMPTAFDEAAWKVIEAPSRDLPRAVLCDHPHIAARAIEAKHGTIIVLENWSPTAAKGLKVTLSIPVSAGKPELASGGAVTSSRDGDKTVFTLDLDVADVLILR